MFNLDINSYTNDELYELFSVDQTNTNITLLNYNYQVLTSKISKSNKSKNEILDTIKFLDKAKDKLLLVISDNTLNVAISANRDMSQNPLDSSRSSKSRNLFVDRVITIDTKFSKEYHLNKPSFLYELSEPIKNIESMDLMSIELPDIICIISKNYQNNHYRINFSEDISYDIALPNICLREEDLSDYSLFENFIKLLNDILKDSDSELLKKCYWRLEEFKSTTSLNNVKKAVFHFDYDDFDILNIPYKVGETVYVTKEAKNNKNLTTDNEFDAEILPTVYKKLNKLERVKGKIINVNTDNEFDSEVLPPTYDVQYDDGNIDKNIKEDKLHHLKDEPEYVELDFTRTMEGKYDLRNIQQKFGYLMGFRDAIIRKDILSNKISIIGDVSMKLSGPKYLYLIVDDFNSNKLETIIADKATLTGCAVDFPLGGNILAKILFDAGSIYYATNRIITITRQYTGPVDVQKLRVSLIDEYGRIAD